MPSLCISIPKRVWSGTLKILLVPGIPKIFRHGTRVLLVGALILSSFRAWSPKNVYHRTWSPVVFLWVEGRGVLKGPPGFFCARGLGAVHPFGTLMHLHVYIDTCAFSAIVAFFITLKITAAIEILYLNNFDIFNNRAVYFNFIHLLHYFRAKVCIKCNTWLVRITAIFIVCIHVVRFIDRCYRLLLLILIGFSYVKRTQITQNNRKKWRQTILYQKTMTHE